LPFSLPQHGRQTIYRDIGGLDTFAASARQEGLIDDQASALEGADGGIVLQGAERIEAES
jgi:hypothetical protein